MNSDMTLAMRLYLESRQFTAGLRQSERSVSRFSGKAVRELRELKGMFGGIKGQMASLGVAFGGTALIKQSAGLDKSLTQLSQTAGATKDQARGLRSELFRMSRETGQGIENLKTGFEGLVQTGLTWQKSLATIDAINPAMAVTGSNAQALASGLTVAAEAFDFDLSQPGLAVDLLDKMVVAGRLGKAELEDLSGIFSRVGVNAKTANLSFDQTLGFLEQLSYVRSEPERLATLADSTLRLFTNENYKLNAQKKLGIDFYNDNGSSRGAIEVLKDIQAKYQTLKSDRQRAAFIQAGFGKTDLDTKTGLMQLMKEGKLTNIEAMVSRIHESSGAISSDLRNAINNAVDQTGRLKSALREAADEFAQPINKAFSEAIKFGLDKEGLNLSGKEIAGGGLALVAGTALAARYGGKGLKALGGKMFGTAGGLAAGKALEAAAGVTPVYVVNMPGGGMGGMGGMDGTIPGLGGKAGSYLPKSISNWKSTLGFLGSQNLKTIGGLGLGAVSGSGAAVLAAGAGGYGIGTLISKAIEGTEVSNSIGRSLARVSATFGNDSAQAALDAEQKAMESRIAGTIRLEIEGGDVRVKELKSDNRDIDYEVYSGMTMAGP